MKKNFAPLLAASVLLGLLPALSPADPNYPVYRVATVSWIIATRNDISKDNTYVTLFGYVTKKIGDETYLFTDGTGKIRLDSADIKLPVGVPIVIHGQIDQAYFGFGDLEVDVRQSRNSRQP
jgi:uncharacterized protein YdeI (BOF family)